MVGDFNTVLEPIVHAITSMMSAVDLVDVWRIKNPDLIRYTHSMKKMNGQ